MIQLASAARQVLLAVFAPYMAIRAAAASLTWAMLYNKEGAKVSTQFCSPAIIADEWRSLDGVQAGLIAAAFVVMVSRWPGFVGSDNIVIVGYYLANGGFVLLEPIRSLFVQ